MREDTGMRISRLARVITPEQMDILFAIKSVMLTIDGATPILALHWPAHAPLVRAKMITWPRAGEPWGANWRRPTLTKLGEQVLLYRAEMLLRQGGHLPAETHEDDAE